MDSALGIPSRHCRSSIEESGSTDAPRPQPTIPSLRAPPNKTYTLSHSVLSQTISVKSVPKNGFGIEEDGYEEEEGEGGMCLRLAFALVLTLVLSACKGHFYTDLWKIGVCTNLL